MKTITPFVLTLLVMITGSVYAQDADQKALFRIYHDNDLFNFPTRESDEAYTGGFRLDVFFEKKHASRFFLDRIFPKAGDASTDIFQWGIMQVMYTPVNIGDSAYEPYDYSYAGGLYVIHSLYSYNAEKKYSFQTEVNLGVMGPPSLAEQTQKLIHHIIHYQQPMGWNYQLKTSLLLNVNFTAEKQLACIGRSVELIGGAQSSIGTQMNALAVYPLIRIGIMQPYFNGYLSQYSPQKHKIQAYFIIKPEAQWVLTNALLEGGLFSEDYQREDDKYISYKSYRDLNHMVYSVTYGVVLVAGMASVSFTQNASTMLIKDTYEHVYGNISLYLKLR